jgi:selenocysteine lyase/cysteine desulfurase
MSLMLKLVREAGLQALETRATPWKIKSQDWFSDAELLRELAAKIFQTIPDNVALIPSASYGLAVAAKNLKVANAKSIIVLDNQFPSNYYVWENMAKNNGLQLKVVSNTTGSTLTESILNAIDSNAGIVAVPNCHWIDGSYIDLAKISSAAKAVDAYLVLDLSQSLGALPINLNEIQPDFAVSVGYKWLLGPYSLGYMYVSPKWQQEGEPLEYSWMTRKDSDDFTKLTGYTNEYRIGARKFDMGEFSQFNLIPMAIAALGQINKWGVDAIQSSINKLNDILYKELKIERTSPGAGHISSISLHGLDVDRIKTKLTENKVVVSFRGTSIRVSPHLYNDENDIDKLLQSLK